MTGHQNKSKEWVCLPLQTVLGKIGDRYLSYCTAYKTHTMTTHHSGSGHIGEDREAESCIEMPGTWI